MSYAIVINLDYVSQAKENCAYVWKIIKQNMINSGFILDKRLLISKKTKLEACQAAREVINNLNTCNQLNGIDVYSYLKDFYGYDHSNSVNLLLPDEDGIIVEDN